jgi:hypothetical protein
MEIAERCPVHRTLTAGVMIETTAAIRARVRYPVTTSRLPPAGRISVEGDAR